MINGTTWTDVLIILFNLDFCISFTSHYWESLIEAILKQTQTNGFCSTFMRGREAGLNIKPVEIVFWCGSKTRNFEGRPSPCTTVCSAI